MLDLDLNSWWALALLFIGGAIPWLEAIVVIPAAVVEGFSPVTAVVLGHTNLGGRCGGNRARSHPILHLDSRWHNILVGVCSNPGSLRYGALRCQCLTLRGRWSVQKLLGQSSDFSNAPKRWPPLPRIPLCVGVLSHLQHNQWCSRLATRRLKNTFSVDSPQFSYLWECGELCSCCTGPAPRCGSGNFDDVEFRWIDCGESCG